MRLLIRIVVFCVPLLSLFAAGDATADPVKLRLAGLMPKNSFYHRTLLELGETWKKAQNDGSTFTVYTDGSQGGEADIVKRMRIGQLNAALISVTGLREIDKSVSVLQSLPLMFRSWDEVDYVRDKMRPMLDKNLLEKGFVVVFWADAGWVQFFSQEPAKRPDDFKRLKMFVWAGEPEQVKSMQALGYHPVALETADMLPALQTGLVNVVPTTPYYALAGQFDSAAPYMLDLNWAPIIGALVVTKKAWDAMTPAGQEALRKAGNDAGAQMRAKARAEDDEAIAAMEKRGLKVTKLTPELQAEWQKFAESTYVQIRGNWVSAESFDEVKRLLTEYRASRGK